VIEPGPAAAEFERDGWIVVRGIVSESELTTMRAIFESFIPENAYMPPGRDGVVGEITGASRAYEPLARIACDARFGALVAAALGATSVQLLQDSLLFKPARDGGQVHWHQDYTYVGFLTPPRAVSLRIALLPEHEDTGCMRVVSGSHHWGPVGDVHALTESRVDSLLPSLSPPQRDAVAAATPLVLEAGDVSIHHCLTVHGSGPNRSGQPRRTIILRMFDGDCRLDHARLPQGAESYFPTTIDGQLATSAFPLVFRVNDDELG
jgi:ectoine hydroxylase-related dioxygenase (phytanoyl-CoA dioxygenase family)